MIKRWLFLCLTLAMTGVGVSQNAPSSGTATAGIQATGNPINWTPQFLRPTDVNAYLVALGGKTLDVAATDACDPGDRWGQIGIGLPGPSIQTSETDGSAEGCFCSHSGGYDAFLSLPSSTLAIVIQRYISGTDKFGATTELQMASTGTFTAIQFRGSDSCGLTAQ